MRRALVRLIVLIAVLLMPFGMVGATAAGHGSRAASMPMPHCPDQDSSHAAKGGIAICSMACAAALPAADDVRERPLALVRAAFEPPLEYSLTGMHPEIATPPPRHS